jgi:PhoPQ-activated pathogenicity-related protein
MEESEGHWETLTGHEDYEIFSEFPNQIRKKINKRILKECINPTSKYIQLSLNGKTAYKHKILAEQYLPNPDQLQQVDHINHNRIDNRLSNLRWISPSDNNRNMSSHAGVAYTFVDEISSEAIHVTEYSGYEFNDLYFHDNTFFYFNGIQYRKLHITELKSGALVVNITNVNHRNVTLTYAKFKREYDLI